MSSIKHIIKLSEGTMFDASLFVGHSTGFDKRHFSIIYIQDSVGEIHKIYTEYECKNEIAEKMRKYFEHLNSKEKLV